jgi:hypothetical protein
MRWISAWILAVALLALSGCAALQKSIAPAAPASTSPAPREFAGWAAINGGGPQARATNNDWHMQDDLRLSIGGARVPLHWRDGVAAGYSLELVRASYPDRKLVVLQLNVIEDAGGKTLTYVWTDDKADAIGLNLGWLQVGLQQVAADRQGTPPAAKKSKP